MRNFNSRLQMRGRRRGVTIVYVSLLLVMFIGICAYGIDMANLYAKRSQAQKAADAAALSGAFQLANFKAKATADQWALYIANRAENGRYYTDNIDTTVTTIFPATNENNVVQNNWYRVIIRRDEPTFFAGFFGMRKVRVGVSATALYSTLAPIDISGTGQYGATGDTNLAMFGPDAQYNNGDCYSSRYLSDGVTKNPLYNDINDVMSTGEIRTAGYNFRINVPLNMGQTQFEIFDPDCYNKTGGSGSQNDAEKGYRIDEWRNKAGSGSSALSDRTTTQYTLYWDNNTPNNPNDDVLVETKSADGDDTGYDMKWNQFFVFNRASYTTGNFRLNVKTTGGSSENGFDLRVGPKQATYDPTKFDPNNGTSIVAEGHLPLNFNTSGQVNIVLGTLPVQAAGGKLTIRKFDTDVNAKSIVYTCSTLPGKSWSGLLSGNGTFATDEIQVPTEYTTAGVWSATYQAGLGDTSIWDMEYAMAGPGAPGSIRLIR